ncbi:MAG: hypothetical protein LBS95_02375 [Mycoplasmataceae bacterium]|nr:hypothetical protein [Mycoplasmataceae bacterium]
MQKNNKTKKPLLSFNLSVIDWKLIFKLILWGALCVCLTLLMIYLMWEKNYYSNLRHNDPLILTFGTTEISFYSISQIRNAIGSGQINAAFDLAASYNKMLEWTEYPANFPIIGFSLMWFIPGTASIPSSTAPIDAWNNRWQGITLAYSYYFITLIIAYVAFAMLGINGIRESRINHKNKKLNVTPYPIKNFTYADYSMKNTTEFILNLALVFAFFNFLSTCIVIIYWLILAMIKGIINLSTKNKVKLDITEFEINKSDVLYLIGVMIFQNAYTILKSYFINGFGVNLDLIMQIIIPIGTVTVIIGLFIKNMLSNKISQVKKKILSIDENILKIRTFYKLKGLDAFDDFDFIMTLPDSMRRRIDTEKLNKISLNDEMQQFIQLTNEIEIMYAKQDLNKKYLLYVAFNKCKNRNEISILRENLIKINQKIKK